MQRKERQAEKLSKRDERRLRRNDPSQASQTLAGDGFLNGEFAPGEAPAGPFANAELSSDGVAADGALPDEAPAVRRRSAMAEGSIKRLTDKGFGFITTESGDDLFFHSSTVQGAAFEQLQVGQRVEFAEGRGPRGPRAEAVRVL